MPDKVPDTASECLHNTATSPHLYNHLPQPNRSVHENPHAPMMNTKCPSLPSTEDRAHHEQLTDCEQPTRILNWSPASESRLTGNIWHCLSWGEGRACHFHSRIFTCTLWHINRWMDFRMNVAAENNASGLGHAHFYLSCKRAAVVPSQ